MATETRSSTQATIDRHDRFMSLNYTRYPIAMVEGSGCRLRDADGKQYLDLFSGFGATIMGHCHPDLVAAVTQQAARLWHVGNLLHTEPQTRVAEAIARHGFGGRSFFCHSGADANAHAWLWKTCCGKRCKQRARPRVYVRTPLAMEMKQVITGGTQ